ncbi:GtrA family protein [Oscillibacter sp.]|uniref:GtrA family protein n=1 Tax=Oscillibacter sp. TaxID=1945593 RepID=UPI0028B074ED|nr:GtrA family protein [Oscillibacter sp.]
MQMKNCLKKCREIIAYGIVGVMNTILNFGVYHVLEAIFGIYYLAANAIAWVLSFLFSFVANKVCVFQSVKWDKDICFKELWSFFCCSVGTGILDMLMLYAMVDLMGVNETSAKAVDVVTVIILNYFIRKFWVFKERM